MQVKKRTILQIAALNPKKIGSFEELMIDLSLELEKLGIEPVLVFNQEVPSNLKSRYTGIELACLSKEKGTLQFYHQLYKLIKKYKPDIVDFHFYPFFSMMTIFVYLCGVRHIIFTDHCSGEIRKKTGIIGFLFSLRNRFIMKFINKMVCVSNFVLERNKAIPGIDASKLTCLYIGIELRKFSSVKNNKEESRKNLFNINTGHFVITTAVNLIKEKGIQYLISAAGLLVKEFPDMTFLIVGEGKEGPELKSKALSLGLHENVKFIGLRSDIDEILGISDVFVYPSIWQEAFGLAIVEAMACGVPVIATRVGGIPELIESGHTGIIIPPSDHLAIAKSIKYLYQNREKLEEMGRNARERVEKIFNIKTKTSKTIDIYKESCI